MAFQGAELVLMSGNRCIRCSRQPSASVRSVGASLFCWLLNRHRPASRFAAGLDHREPSVAFGSIGALLIGPYTPVVHMIVHRFALHSHMYSLRSGANQPRADRAEGDGRRQTSFAERDSRLNFLRKCGPVTILKGFFISK